MNVGPVCGAALLSLSAAFFIGEPVRAQDDWSRADSAIVRLAPAAFPGLRDAVQTDLERRGCLVPQVADAPDPHNVIWGSFTGARQNDVAVLCSIDGASRILIYREAGVSAVDSLALVADRDLLQTMGGDRIVYSRRILAVDSTYVRKLTLRAHIAALSGSLDHDGIEDIFEGKASVVLYFHAGRWHRLLAAD